MMKYVAIKKNMKKQTWRHQKNIKARKEFLAAAS